MELGVINYGGGNLRSLVRALEFLGVQPRNVSKPEDFEGLTHLAFPGQGSFGDSMRNMEERGLVEPLKEWLEADKPFFGICIGYQLLFEGSEESPETPGLGILEGKVERFPADMGLKVPHMGWNTAQPTDPADPIWKDLEPDPYFYFVHSFYPHPLDSDVIASTTDYGFPFASSVRKGNLFATQFHPEKSQHTGLQLLKNFLQ
ncbi:imidazole glycerol phosphate synthase subunit HisH [Roseibacillus persicicus]|uniref:Imidazole glycerol phosphate synthase subunit HisH n=1 Tax=Roseibacillus persicicus TaxID=454148 RepID=A0A918WJY2_9BACT|nr:imidazole glycerol phosphate synthase subunit HisH [Roseibacillus persicicus]GHC52695.1 imidazole glycerol phosphate synthase subunit HisH [Roseibacillus persicicus]